jgi:hypothetical protein
MTAPTALRVATGRAWNMAVIVHERLRGALRPTRDLSLLGMVQSVEFRRRATKAYDRMLPFSCPLDATSAGKPPQSATQSEGKNRPVFIGWSAQSGSLAQQAAKGR